MEAAHEKEQIEARHRINTLIIISLVIILAALLALLLVRKRSSDRLRQQNIYLEEARQRAERSEQMKISFIQNMTHEIRTPLNAIVGFSQLLADPQMSEMLSPEEKTEYSSLISNNADMLTQLVSDVLHMSDMQTGTLPINREWCECNAIGHISTQNIEPHSTNDVRLHFTSELPDDFRIYTDRHRVQQILTNFLINAYKFTSSGEIQLHISRQETPGYVTFSVTDTGPGIPADQAEFIFERFAKLDNFKQGFGLGLTICRQIAELLGGKVYLDTSYTDGARFVFIHPIEPDNL
jgi:signal transduction histidine kinase